MAGNDRWHNKWHQRNHHTNQSTGYLDSATDPIASYAAPFQGDFIILGSLSAFGSLSAVNIITQQANFQNTVTNAISAQSGTISSLAVPTLTAAALTTMFLTVTSTSTFQGLASFTVGLSTTTGTNTTWGSVFTTVNANSANWGSVNNATSVYTTVNANSGSWQGVFSTVLTTSAFWGSSPTTLAANSGNWNSVFNTVNTNSATWSIPYLPIAGGSVTGGLNTSGSFVSIGPVNLGTGNIVNGGNSSIVAAGLGNYNGSANGTFTCGWSNSALNNSNASFICGVNNSAFGGYSGYIFMAGGNNIAQGQLSNVTGSNNIARSGTLAYVAGQYADDGGQNRVWVWSDGSNASTPVSAHASFTFTVYATNGFVLKPVTRPSQTIAGQIYFDQSLSALCFYDGTRWHSLTGF